jgi:hypothetical protein
MYVNEFESTRRIFNNFMELLSLKEQNTGLKNFSGRFRFKLPAYPALLQ